MPTTPQPDTVADGPLTNGADAPGNAPSSTAPVGIIIANTGSPAEPTSEAVYAYLADFLMDDRIIQMPRILWKQLVFRHILPKRQHASAEKYRAIWTSDGSPLIENSRRLASKLELALVDAGINARARIAMSYGSPSLNDACTELQAAGCDRLVVLPNYPQSAYSITGSVYDQYQRARNNGACRLPSCFIENYSDDDIYRQAIADSIREAGFGTHPDDRLLLDFHSVPLKDCKNGDTYPEQILADAADFAERLDIDPARAVIGYSSVFGHREDDWLGPLSRDLLREWGAQMADSQGRVFFATPGFAVNCLETLWDIPYELQPAFVEGGGQPERFVTVPPLNDSDRHVAVLVHVLKPYC